MLTRQQKTEKVEVLKTTLDGANALLVVDYRGLSVKDANDLRGRLRQADASFRYHVVKNSLLKRAIEGTDVAAADPYLVGPTAVAIAYEEPSALAKVLVDYAKDNEAFEIKGGVVEGEAVDAAKVQQLASLPSKEEMRGMLAGTVQAPMRNLAGAVNAVMGNLRNALEQRMQQLEADA